LVVPNGADEPVVWKAVGVPRSIRQFLSDLCRENGIEARHLVAALAKAVESEAIPLAKLGQYLEEAVYELDGSVRYNSTPCPWRTRSRLGWGTWVRLPKRENGGAVNVAETTEPVD